MLVLGIWWLIWDDNKQVKVAGVIVVVVVVVVLASLLRSMRGMLIMSAAVVTCLFLVFRIHGMSAGQLSISGFVMIGTALVAAVAAALRRGRWSARVGPT